LSATNEFSRFTTRLHAFMAVAEKTWKALNPCSPIETGSDFQELALELFTLQFKYNAPYRRFCEGRGATPGTVEHWSQIPAVPTAAFKELELSCFPASSRTRVFHSSGTTEQRPSRHFHCAGSLKVYEASLWPWFSAHLLPEIPWAGASAFASAPGESKPDRAPGLRLVVLTPLPLQAPNSSLVHMFETVRRKIGAPESIFLGHASDGGAWSLDMEGVAKAFHAACEARQPLMVLGTAFSFVHLLDDLREHELRIQLPTGSRVLETGGYKGRSRTVPRAELHQELTRYLHVPSTGIVTEYGMSELSSQAYDRVCGGQPEFRDRSEAHSGTTHAFGVLHFPPWARARIISPETGREVAEGETGLIQVFDLANVYSVQAIQTEDLGRRRGNGFELIGRATLSEPRGCSLMATEVSTR
jgi:Acyl-protein synthetase, LuxE